MSKNNAKKHIPLHGLVVWVLLCHGLKKPGRANPFPNLQLVSIQCFLSSSCHTKVKNIVCSTYP